MTNHAQLFLCIDETDFTNVPTMSEETPIGLCAYTFDANNKEKLSIADPYLYDKTISFWAKVPAGTYTTSNSVPFLIYNDGVAGTSGDSNQIMLAMRYGKFRMDG